MHRVMGRRIWIVALGVVLALVAGIAMPAQAGSPIEGVGNSDIEASQMPGILSAQGVALVDGRLTAASASEAPLLLAQAGTGSRPGGAATKAADEWRVIFTPLNFWAFEVHGDVGARGVSRDLDISFSDIQDSLDWSVGGRVEVGRGPWSVFVSAAYLAFKEDNLRGPGPLGVSADAELDMLLLEFGGFYRLATVPLGPVQLRLDGQLGARYLRVDTEIKADNGAFDKDKSGDLIDPLVGLRLVLPITEAFGARVAGNVGGFGLTSSQSHFSWAFSGDIHYTWQVTKAFGLNFAAGYSILDINWDGGDPNKHELDLQFRGPFVALSLVF